MLSFESCRSYRTKDLGQPSSIAAEGVIPVASEAASSDLSGRPAGGVDDGQERGGAPSGGDGSLQPERPRPRILLHLAILAPVFAASGFLISSRGAVTPMMAAGYFAIFAACASLIKICFAAYRRGRVGRRLQSGFSAIVSLYLALPLSYLVYAALSSAEVRQELMALSAMTAVFGVLVGGAGLSFSERKSALLHRVLVFGTGDSAHAVEKAVGKLKSDIRIVGFYPSPYEFAAAVPAGLILPRTKSLMETALEMDVNEIVVAVAERRGGAMPLRQLLDCKLCGMRVVDLESHFEKRLGQIRLDSLYAGWLIFGEGFRQGIRRTLVKRLFDLACAASLLLLALPVMVLTALLIVLESGFPILYRQERVGLNGRMFNVVKFRSMRTDAEKDGRPRWASSNDDRITRVGRIIRKLRIDELPQLLSVLKGDMSLVGPRPERPFFVDKLTREIPFYAVRHSVKPGVTGWAQVRYHYGSSIEDAAEKLQYDLYYVKNHSLLLDIMILMETVGVVLTAKGAQ